MNNFLGRLISGGISLDDRIDSRNGNIVSRQFKLCNFISKGLFFGGLPNGRDKGSNRLGHFNSSDISTGSVGV